MLKLSITAGAAKSGFARFVHESATASALKSSSDIATDKH